MIWALLCLILLVSWFTPWWIYLLLCAFVGWKARSAVKAFFTGFTGAGLAWVMAAYYQDMQSGGLMSQRLSKMFSLPEPLFIFAVIWIIAGVSGGLFCVAGFYLSQLRPIKRLSLPEDSPSA